MTSTRSKSYYGCEVHFEVFRRLVQRKRRAKLWSELEERKRAKRKRETKKETSRKIEERMEGAIRRASPSERSSGRRMAGKIAVLMWVIRKGNQERRRLQKA